MKRSLLLAAAAIVAVLPARSAAEADLGGFVEGAGGVRTATSPVHEGDTDYTLQEARVQLRLQAYGDVGEAFAKIDFLNDQVLDDATQVEVREGYLRFTTIGDRLDVKVGRQISTWGTGDLLFINDIFPRDWESFFIGRSVEYLKAPANMLRLGFYGLPFDVDFTVLPKFTPDRFPVPGERLSNPAPGPGVGEPVEPAFLLENAELALRIGRYIGNWALALYGYRGFFDLAVGLTPDPDPTSSTLHPYYPKLSVWGASLQGGALGGVMWVEGGWYDSREDRDGTDPLVPNSSVRAFAGYERQFWTDFTAGAQLYGEQTLDFDESVGAGPGQGETRTLVTLRLEQLLYYQTVRLSFFIFQSLDDEDGYARPVVGYDVSDAIDVTLGANVFWGDAGTPFGTFDHDDNVYLRFRYGF